MPETRIRDRPRNPSGPTADRWIKAKPQPSVGRLGLSMAQYIELCDTFRDKAQTAHDDARKWANRALLAEARLATLRAEYEPHSTRKEN